VLTGLTLMVYYYYYYYFIIFSISASTRVDVDDRPLPAVDIDSWYMWYRF